MVTEGLPEGLAAETSIRESVWLEQGEGGRMGRSEVGGEADGQEDLGFCSRWAWKS